MRKAVIVVVLATVMVALAAGFYLIGPPADARARRLDDRREMDLQRLRLAADLYWTRNGRLPGSLDELAKEAGTNIYSRDPDDGRLYEYTVSGADSYELCAVFGRDSELQGFWSHGAGRQCFEVRAREIRP